MKKTDYQEQRDRYIKQKTVLGLIELKESIENDPTGFINGLKSKIRELGLEYNIQPETLN